MKITLVRNAQTEENFLDICEGIRKNNSLNDEGRRNCLKMKAQIKNKQYDYCYMSPLLRSVETAINLIGDRVETIPDKRLIDRSLGEFEGMPHKFYDHDKYLDYNLNSSDRGVEPIQSVFARCRDFLEYIKSKHRGQNIMIVSHEITIEVIKNILLNRDVHKILKKFDIPNLYMEEFTIKD